MQFLRPGFGVVAASAGLTAIGIAGIISAVYDPALALGLGKEAAAQLLWLLLALGCGGVVARIPFRWWRQLAAPAYVAVVAVVVIMTVLTAVGSSLVPRIKGQANWLVLGPLRVQPVEFLKLALLLAFAGLCAWPGFDARRLLHILVAGVVAVIPVGLIAREDLGSALTLIPMLAAVIMVAGLRWQHALLVLVVGAGVLIAGVSQLPREGPKAYQWRRIDAWLNPDAYQAAEGFQAERSVRSIGNGGWLGQGFANGDQNRLGWVPEKHTDMIIAVIGEEGGFILCLIVLLLYASFALASARLAMGVVEPSGFRAGLASGMGATSGSGSGDRMPSYVIIGGAGLIVGQAAINLMVATRMMPVTGVTLPFVSYGGSSLLAMWTLVGMMLAAGRARSPVAAQS